MSGNVFANKRSILHARDGLTHVCAPPDVCKTPTPGGPPVPLPYVNAARTARLKDGSKRCFIQKASIAIEGSYLADSTGDEPGTLGGLISNKNRGKLGFLSQSLDVKVEGKGVVRFADAGLGNGNSYNTAYPALFGSASAVAYGDDSEDDCPRCRQQPISHRILVPPALATAEADLFGAIVERVQALIDERLRGLELVPSPADRKEEKRNAAIQRERDRLTSLSDVTMVRGKMFGVVLCKCSTDAHRHFFAAYSSQAQPGRPEEALFGQQVFDMVWEAPLLHDVFREAVRHLAQRDDETWHCEETVTFPEEILAVGPDGSIAPIGGQPTREGNLIRWAMPQADGSTRRYDWERSRDRDIKPNQPFCCAASRALQLCYKQGHIPAALIEVYRAGRKGSKEVSTRPRTYHGPQGSTVPDLVVRVASSRQESYMERGERSTGSGNVAPHCGTCAELIPLMLCHRVAASCGGGS